jgi:hypothetical protein
VPRSRIGEGHSMQIPVADVTEEKLVDTAVGDLDVGIGA